MKRVVLFAMVLMLGVVSVQAQWSVVPEAGMTVMKAGPMVDWKPSWKIGVGVEYQLKPEFLSLKSGLYYMQRGYSNDWFPGYGYGSSWWTVPGPTYDPYGYAYDYSNKVTRNFLQLPIMANFSFKLAEDIRLNVGVGPYIAVSVLDKGMFGGWSVASEESAKFYTHDPCEGLRAFDWGISATVGVEIKQCFINFGYDVSLGKEYKGGSIEANYHTLALTAGYKFKLGK